MQKHLTLNSDPYVNSNQRLAKESILDEQIKEFCDKYTDKFYNYEFVRNLEDMLNRGEAGHSPRLQVVDNINGIDFVIPLDSKTTFGSANEVLLGRYLKTEIENWNKYDLTPLEWPNGQMNFPDFGIHYKGTDVTVYLDFKAVCSGLYKNGSNLISPKYSSSLGDYETIHACVKQFTDLGIVDELSSALIILTYYSVDETNERCTIEYIKVVPFLFYISVSKDNTRFQVKQAGKVMNVTGALRIKEGNFEEVYLDPLRTVIYPSYYNKDSPWRPGQLNTKVDNSF